MIQEQKEGQCGWSPEDQWESEDARGAVGQRSDHADLLCTGFRSSFQGQEPDKRQWEDGELLFLFKSMLECALRKHFSSPRRILKFHKFSSITYLLHSDSHGLSSSTIYEGDAMD